MNNLNLKIAKSLVSYVDHEHKFPATIKVDNVSYNYGTFTKILADTIVNTDSKYTGKVYQNAPSTTGDSINTKINKTEYIRLAREVSAFMNTNKRCPNYLTYQGKKIRPRVFTYAFAQIIIFISKNKRYPNYATFNSTQYMPKQTEPLKSNDEVFNYFVKVFGKVTTIDEALTKVKEHGYSYYYDDVYSNKTCIDRMKNRQGINCTDSCQVFYHIAKALGYNVTVEHVYCTGTGGGHVRLKLSKNGNTFRRDPACILSQNGKPLNAIWCENGKLIDTNPSWFMDSINRWYKMSLSEAETKVLLETRLRNLKRKYAKVCQHADLTDTAIELKHEIEILENELR